MVAKWSNRYQLRPGRWVFEPTEDSRIEGRRIKRAVSSQWTPPPFYFHLRKGGHVAAVQSHSHHSSFYRADLDDFFGRVNRSRVARCLKRWFSHTDARDMAGNSVVKRPGSGSFMLPYGFVQSPILASLALDQSRLGKFLRRLHSRADVAISVYVDDIILSGDDEIELLELAAQLQLQADLSKLPLSATKRQGPGKSVTVFNIEISHSLLKITEERLEALSLAYRAATSESKKAGIASYVDSVNSAQVSEL